MRRRPALIALALMLSPIPLVLAQKQEATTDPQVLAGACAGCHGTAGHSPSAMPTLAGMPADTFVKTMQAFRSGERQGTVMNRHAKGYTDDEIQAMAKYFEAQKAAGGKK